MRRRNDGMAGDRFVRDVLSASAGAGVRSFLSNDLFFIAILSISGAFTLAGRFGAGTTLGDAFFGLYKPLLAATLCSFVFLRLLRGKRYSEDEKPAVVDAAFWIALSASISVAVLAAEMFVLDILDIAGLAWMFSDAALFLWMAVTCFSAAYLLWAAYRRSKTGLAAFAARRIDGLAWLALFGGIGGLAVLDLAYVVLLLASYAGLLF